LAFPGVATRPRPKQAAAPPQIFIHPPERKYENPSLEKKDPVHKKIMHTKDELVENDEFDPEEAMEAAVDKRKFLIRRLLKGYKFDDDDDDDDDDEKNDDDT
jgi:hypothetical protein